MQSKLPGLIELKYHSIGDAVAAPGPPDNIREMFECLQKKQRGQAWTIFYVPTRM